MGSKEEEEGGEVEMEIEGVVEMDFACLRMDSISFKLRDLPVPSYPFTVEHISVIFLSLILPSMMGLVRERGMAAPSSMASRSQYTPLVVWEGGIYWMDWWEEEEKRMDITGLSDSSFRLPPPSTSLTT